MLNIKYKGEYHMTSAFSYLLTLLGIIFWILRAVIAVMEVDDSSHNTAERAIRDDFVDKVLTKCGYRIIHTYNGSNIENVLKYNRII